MGTFIIFHSEAGIVLRAGKREQAASHAFPFATADISSISSDHSWRNRFASELDGDSGVTVHDDGATVLRGYVGEISYSNYALLRAVIKNADAGGVCTLSEEDGPLPLTTLYVCNGDGTATAHEAVTVFPTYAGVASGMADANETLEGALDDKNLTLDVMQDLAPDHVPDSWTAVQDLASIESALPGFAARFEAGRADRVERAHDAFELPRRLSRTKQHDDPHRSDPGFPTPL